MLYCDMCFNGLNSNKMYIDVLCTSTNICGVSSEATCYLSHLNSIYNSKEI